MKWEDVNKVIKWTLKNSMHLDVSDIYLIEKATDDCHGYLAVAEGLCILENPCSDDTPGDCTDDCIYHTT